MPAGLDSTFFAGFGFGFDLAATVGFAVVTTTWEAMGKATKRGGGGRKIGSGLRPMITIGRGGLGGYCTAW